MARLVMLYIPRRPTTPAEHMERALDLRAPRVGFVVTVVRVAGTRSWSASYQALGDRVELGRGTLTQALQAAGRYLQRGLIGAKLEVVCTPGEVKEARAVMPELRDWCVDDEALADGLWWTWQHGEAVRAAELTPAQREAIVQPDMTLVRYLDGAGEGRTPAQ